MRSATILSATALIYALSAAGCGVAHPEPAPRQPAGQATPFLIDDDARTFAFGSVVTTTSKSLEHGFQLVNRTRSDVKIVEVANRKPCCGEVRIDKTVLRPGETAGVVVAIRVADKVGDVEHYAVVATDPPAPSDMVLITRAKAFPPLRIEEVGDRPGTMVLGADAPRCEFKAIAYGTVSEPPVDLDRVKLASSTNVEWLGPKDQGPGEEGLIVATRRFAMTLDSRGVVGARSAAVALATTDSGPLLEHVIRWEVVPPITAAPKVVVLSAEGGPSRIILRAGDGKPFRVTNVTCATPGVEGTVTSERAGSTQVLVFKLAGKPALDGGRGAFTIETNNRSMPQLEIPFVILN